MEYAAAGRQTLAAIAEDLVPPDPDPKPARSPREVEVSTPDLEFKLVPAGRETLAAITAEVGPLRRAVERVQPKADHPSEEPKTGVRPRLRTRGYSEPPPSVEQPRMTTPGVAPPPNTMPSTAAKPAQGEKLGRDTLDAIEKAVLEPVPSSRRAAGVALDVFELMTFVVRGDDLAQLSSEATRREFVSERLLHRLPVATMDQVDRIDVTPWTVSGTLILRVWCRVKGKR